MHIHMYIYIYILHISFLAIIFPAKIIASDGAQGNLIGQLSNELSHASTIGKHPNQRSWTWGARRF